MRKALLTAIGAGALALGGSCFPALAAKVKGKRIERTFTEVVVGARISSAGGRFENVYRVTSSPDGGGAIIQDGQLHGSTYPVNVTDGTISFFRDGDRTTRDTYTIGVPGTDGLASIKGNGICTNGTNFHKFETCTYTVRGTINLTTSVVKLTLRGSDTRPASAPFH